MQIAEFAERVIKTANPTLVVHFFELFSQMTSEVALLPIARRILQFLRLRMNIIPLEELALLQEIGIDVMAAAACQLQHKATEFCVLLLDCLSLTEPEEVSSLDQLQGQARNQFKQQSFTRFVCNLDWKCLSPRTLQLLLTNLKNKFILHGAGYLAIQSPGTFFLELAVLLNDAEEKSLDLLFEIISVINTPSQIVVNGLKTVFQTLFSLNSSGELTLHFRVLDLLATLVQTHEKQLLAACLEDKALLEEDRKDFRLLLVSLLQGYINNFANCPDHTYDLAIKKTLRGLFGLLLLRESIIEKQSERSSMSFLRSGPRLKHKQMIQVLLLLRIAGIKLKGETTYFLFCYGLQNFDRIGPLVASLVFEVAGDSFDYKDEILWKCTVSYLHQANLPPQALKLHQFCTLVEKTLLGQKKQLLVQTALILTDLFISHNPGRGISNILVLLAGCSAYQQQLQKLVGGTFPTAAFVLSLLKTCQSLLFNEVKGMSFFYSMVVNYLCKHQLVLSFSAKIVSWPELNQFWPYGVCQGVVALSLEHLSDQTLAKVLSLSLIEKMPASQKKRFKLLIAQTKAEKSSYFYPFQENFIWQIACAEVLTRILNPTASLQSKIHYSQMLHPRLLSQLLAFVKVVGLSHQRIPCKKQNQVEQISNLKEEANFKSRQSNLEPTIRKTLQQGRKRVKQMLKTLISKKDVEDKSIIVTLVEGVREDNQFINNSIYNYRKKLILLQFQVNSMCKKNDFNLNVNALNQLRSKSQKVCEDISRSYFQYLNSREKLAKANRKERARRWKQLKKRHTLYMAQLLQLPRFYKQSKLESRGGLRVFNQIDLGFDKNKYEKGTMGQALGMKDILKGTLKDARSSYAVEDIIKKKFISRLLSFEGVVNRVWDLQLQCQYISRTKIIFGKLRLRKSQLHFSSKKTAERAGPWLWSSDRNAWSERHKQKTLKLKLFQKVFKRRILYKMSGIQFFTYQIKSYLFNFGEPAQATAVLNYLKTVRPTGCLFVQNPKQDFKKSGICQRWVKNQISSYEYLMELNRYSGRSYNDLSQYPVFPWVPAEFKSQSHPQQLRDLSKPIGALNPEKFKRCQTKLGERKDMPDQYINLYDSFFSAPTIVKNYLIRVEPFLSLHYQLQGKRIDVADRLFYSIEQQFNSCLLNDGDFKQLIPQFYCYPHFLQNLNGVNLGTKQNGVRVQSVKLPAWASSPEQCVTIFRQSLESTISSSTLNSWIDLVFGFKASKEHALQHNNLFETHTYEGPHLQSADDDSTKNCKIARLAEFGQFPIQLFTDPHPVRKLRKKIKFDKLLFYNSQKLVDYKVVGSRIVGVTSSKQVLQLAITYNPKQKYCQLGFQGKAQLLKGDFDLVGGDDILAVRNQNGFSLVSTKKLSRYHKIQNVCLGLQRNFLVIADKNQALKCFMVSPQLQLDRLWQLKQPEEIVGLTLKQRLIFVQTKVRFCVYSLFGKYMSGTDLEMPLLKFDAIQAGLCVILKEDHQVLVLGFDCKVLAKVRLQYYLGQAVNATQHTSSVSYFNQYLPTIAVSTNAGRIFSLQLFDVVDSYAKGSSTFAVTNTTSKNLLKQLPFPQGKEGHKLQIRRANLPAFFNMLWINEEGVLHLAFEQKRMGDFHKEELLKGPLAFSLL